MADYKDIIPFIKKWEGGLSKDPNDSASAHACPTAFKNVHGYHTNKGVTYAVWFSIFGGRNDARFFEMNDDDWGLIFKPNYWDRVKGDYIKSQSVANILVDIAWMSGVVPAAKTLKKSANALGATLTVDGLIENNTITTINAMDEKALFESIVANRKGFLVGLAKSNPRNEKFLKGWLNRLENCREKYTPKTA